LNDVSIFGADGAAFTADDGFNILAGSPAVNNGTDFGQTRDVMGNAILGAPDIGAYESSSQQTSFHPADLDQSCDISIGEIVSFIGLWQTDSTAYPMRTMMDAVGKWKSGRAC
jgi:hypothetical protein